MFSSTLPGSSSCLTNPILLPYVIMTENDKSAEKSPTPSPALLEQPTTNELESKTSVQQPFASEESPKDANDNKLESVTFNNVIQNEVPVQNLQTQIIKTVSEQVCDELPSVQTLPLEQPNLTILQSGVAQSHAQPSMFSTTLPGSSTCLTNPILLPHVIMTENDKLVEKSPTPSLVLLEQPTTNELESKTSVPQPFASEESPKDANDSKLETVTFNNVIQNEAPVQNLQTQIIKTGSEQVCDELPSVQTLPLEQPNLTQLQSGVAQSQTQPSMFSSTLPGSSTCLTNPILLPYVIMTEDDKSVEKSPTPSPALLEQSTTNELESKTSVPQPFASEESPKDANDSKLETVTFNNVIQNEAPVQNLQTQIIKTGSEQVYVELPLAQTLPLEQPNLTQLQSEVAQLHAQPSTAEEPVDIRSLPAEDDDGGQLETKRASKRSLNESSEQELELKVTSPNADVTILPVEKTDDDQLEPPSKKIRSEEPTQQLQVALLEHFKNPSSWSDQCDDETKEIEIREGSSEYHTVKANISTELRKELRICRLQNPYLYHRYMLRKAEYIARGIRVHERTLLHATDSCKVQSILRDNLNWRLVSRDKYGRGTSFSHSSLYANKECNKRNGSRRAMLISKVLVGRECRGSQSLKLPPGDYDTTTGNTNVVVKYYDDEFYPEYVVYYTDQQTRRLRRALYCF